MAPEEKILTDQQFDDVLLLASIDPAVLEAVLLEDRRALRQHPPVHNAAEICAAFERLIQFHGEPGEFCLALQRVFSERMEAAAVDDASSSFQVQKDSVLDHLLGAERDEKPGAEAFWKRVSGLAVLFRDHRVKKKLQLSQHKAAIERNWTLVCEATRTLGVSSVHARDPLYRQIREIDRLSTDSSDLYSACQYGDAEYTRSTRYRLAQNALEAWICVHKIALASEDGLTALLAVDRVLIALDDMFNSQLGWDAYNVAARVHADLELTVRQYADEASLVSFRLRLNPGQRAEAIASLYRNATQLLGVDMDRVFQVLSIPEGDRNDEARRIVNAVIGLCSKESQVVSADLNAMETFVLTSHIDAPRQALADYSTRVAEGIQSSRTINALESGLPLFLSRLREKALPFLSLQAAFQEMRARITSLYAKHYIPLELHNTWSQLLQMVFDRYEEKQLRLCRSPQSGVVQNLEAEFRAVVQSVFEGYEPYENINVARRDAYTRFAEEQARVCDSVLSQLKAQYPQARHRRLDRLVGEVKTQLREEQREYSAFLAASNWAVREVAPVVVDAKPLSFDRLHQITSFQPLDRGVVQAAYVKELEDIKAVCLQPLRDKLEQLLEALDRARHDDQDNLRAVLSEARALLREPGYKKYKGDLAALYPNHCSRIEAAVRYAAYADSDESSSVGQFFLGILGRLPSWLGGRWSRARMAKQADDYGQAKVVHFFAGDSESLSVRDSERDLEDGVFRSTFDVTPFVRVVSQSPSSGYVESLIEEGANSFQVSVRQSDVVTSTPVTPVRGSSLMRVDSDQTLSLLALSANCSPISARSSLRTAPPSEPGSASRSGSAATTRASTPTAQRRTAAPASLLASQPPVPVTAGDAAAELANGGGVQRRCWASQFGGFNSSRDAAGYDATIRHVPAALEQGGRERRTAAR